ncbi:ferredoxin [Frankia tisae]|uniref:ferredoxin n=1 Tax=Frankia tisae TaxID=2950104 RepID=UPI0021C13FDA|nr:ferredoxin [Frankia tisae]
MRVIVDHDLCVGAGQCVRAAPEVFEQSDLDGKSQVLQPVPDWKYQAAVREAAVRMCPARAISVVG